MLRCLVVALGMSLTLLSAAPSPAVTITATAVGRVVTFPDLGVPAQVNESFITARYERSLPENTRIDRGMFEFDLPDTPVASAQLEFESHRSTNLDFDLHVYGGADLAVTVEDFDRPAVFFDSFNPFVDGIPLIDVSTLVYDVTALVNANIGGNLGFRYSVPGDLTRDDFITLVNSIEGPTSDYGAPRLVFTLVPEPGTAALLAFGLMICGARGRRA
jgi:hypothetical protein